MSKSPKKRSSKASSPSWRTLLRQAEKLEKAAGSGPIAVKNRKRAAALREQANLKHRSERKAKAKPPAKKRKTVKQRVAARLSKVDPMAQALFGDNAAPATLGGIHRVASQAWPPNKPDLPGHGELVGGEMSRLADEIAALARKKGGKDEIQSKLMMATATAAYEGERKADQRHMQNVKDIHEATTDKIVCAAIAVFDNDPQFRDGMPPAIMISSYTLCRMIDALNRAGYTAKGKR